MPHSWNNYTPLRNCGCGSNTVENYRAVDTLLRAGAPDSIFVDITLYQCDDLANKQCTLPNTNLPGYGLDIKNVPHYVNALTQPGKNTGWSIRSDSQGLFQMFSEKAGFLSGVPYGGVDYRVMTVTGDDPFYTRGSCSWRIYDSDRRPVKDLGSLQMGKPYYIVQPEFGLLTRMGPYGSFASTDYNSTDPKTLQGDQWVLTPKAV